MKQTLIIIFISLFYLILAPGFLCGPGPRGDCYNFKSDTANMQFSIMNPSAIYHVNDSIRLTSNVSDTLHAVSGTTFINVFDRLNTNINIYKVVTNGSASELNYASNEFNVLVQTGSFQNTGGTGFEITYNRVQPFNKLEATIVPGHPGLYLVTTNPFIYSVNYDLEVFDHSNVCTNYKCFADILPTQQQRQYWDSLGTTTLRPANSNYRYINKDDSYYFFVKVLP